MGLGELRLDQQEKAKAEGSRNQIAAALERGELVCEDIYLYPAHEGKKMSWTIEKYLTISEEQRGFPRIRRIIQMMKLLETDRLDREILEFKKSYGYAKQKCLSIVEDELSRCKDESETIVNQGEMMP